MKKILFPTDFSDTSLNAFEYALNIANQLGARIATVHTFTTPVVSTTPVVMVEQMTELTEQLAMQEYTAFNKKIHELATEMDLTHIQIDHTLEFGLTIGEVINISKKDGTDLIIMGSEGAEGLRKWLFGSHATSIIEKATCPVLVVPNEAVYQPISKIAYATNFEDIDDAIFSSLLEWVGKFDATLDFIHVTDKTELIDAEQYANMSEIKALAERYENVRFRILYDTDIVEQLDDYMEAEKIDMLVMVTHKYPFFKRLFNPSLTRQMAFDTEMPLLVFQAPTN